MPCSGSLFAKEVEDEDDYDDDDECFYNAALNTLPVDFVHAERVLPQSIKMGNPPWEIAPTLRS